jgi:hypothetical protein
MNLDLSRILWQVNRPAPRFDFSLSRGLCQQLMEVLGNMKNLLRYAMLTLVVALVGSSAAYAIPSVPEVDPGMAISGFALLAGAVAVLRVRRSK